MEDGTRKRGARRWTCWRPVRRANQSPRRAAAGVERLSSTRPCPGPALSDGILAPAPTVSVCAESSTQDASLLCTCGPKQTPTWLAPIACLDPVDSSTRSSPWPRSSASALSPERRPSRRFCSCRRVCRRRSLSSAPSARSDCRRVRPLGCDGSAAPWGVPRRKAGLWGAAFTRVGVREIGNEDLAPLDARLSRTGEALAVAATRRRWSAQVGYISAAAPWAQPALI